MDKAPLVSSGDFGESNYGQRLQYTKPVYRDIVFAIAYYIHVIIVLAAGGYLWFTQYPNISTSGTWSSDVSLTGIFIGIGCCLLAGIAFGLLWLEIMKRFASTIIKSMLFLNIGCWVLVALIGFVTNILLVIIGVIMALIYALWTWCIWNRIPFASALLSVSSNIISKYGGTTFLSLCVIIANIVWIFIWASCSSAYFLVESDQSQQSQVIIFLLLVSLYWGFQVNQNISHTTTCGVAATWYFSSMIDYNPTPRAFKRTMTTSFGSVCLGSLLVAILEAMRAMIRNAQNGKNDLLKCIALCLLNCIERMVRYFNKYAYAQCAIYGTSFITSAKRTLDLFSTRGILALINDDLTGLAIFAGALIGGVVTAGIGYAVGYVFYNGNSDNDVAVGVPIGLAVYGFFIGVILCQTVLYVVHSAIICLFVCYSEDPATLQQNRPEEYNRICNAKPEFAAICNEYGQQRQQQYPAQQQQQQQQQSGPGYNDGNMYNNGNKFAV